MLPAGNLSNHSLAVSTVPPTSEATLVWRPTQRRNGSLSGLAHVTTSDRRKKDESDGSTLTAVSTNPYAADAELREQICAHEQFYSRTNECNPTRTEENCVFTRISATNGTATRKVFDVTCTLGTAQNSDGLSGNESAQISGTDADNDMKKVSVSVRVGSNNMCNVTMPYSILPKNQTALYSQKCYCINLKKLENETETGISCRCYPSIKGTFLRPRLDGPNCYNGYIHEKICELLPVDSAGRRNATCVINPGVAPRLLDVQCNQTSAHGMNDTDTYDPTYVSLLKQIMSQHNLETTCNCTCTDEVISRMCNEACAITNPRRKKIHKRNVVTNPWSYNQNNTYNSENATSNNSLVQFEPVNKSLCSKCTTQKMITKMERMNTYSTLLSTYLDYGDNPKSLKLNWEPLPTDDPPKVVYFIYALTILSTLSGTFFIVVGCCGARIRDWWLKRKAMRDF